MLFHTLPFALFLLVVLPVFFLLRRTPFWIPWLLAASYFFYAWWNPYYLLLIAYSTSLDYALVTLMERCPLPGKQRDQPRDRLLTGAFVACGILAAVLVLGAIAGPQTHPSR